MKPLGMTLDHSRNVLYWADGAKGAIEMCDIYGKNRKTFFKVKHANFFGIALYKASAIYISTMLSIHFLLTFMFIAMVVMIQQYLTYIIELCEII